jgi:gamma-glutamyltranspeptidase / glutathione hydrolase
MIDLNNPIRYKTSALFLGVVLTAVGCAKSTTHLADANTAQKEKKELFSNLLNSRKSETETIAKKGLVTGTTGAFAQQAGLSILKAGGNAADAVVATAMTQVCLAAGSWVSYAGIMNVVYFDAASGKTYDMNASYDTVEGETDAASIPAPDFSKGLAGVVLEPTGRNVVVPGFLKGADALVKRFGKLPLKEVVTPSIRCAEDGLIWNPGLADQAEFRHKELSRDPETRAVYFKADGSAYQAGDTFKQPALAKTLRAFSEQGSDYIYKGAWAEKLVSKVQALGGKLSMKDMTTYDVIWGQPDRGTYHGVDVYVHGRPAQGGVDTIEALNLLEAANLTAKGHYSESAHSLYWMSQLMKVNTTLNYGGQALADAAAALGVDVSPAGRLTKANAAKLLPIIQAGQFPGIAKPKGIPAHSDAVVVVDQWGNMAAMVHTINTVSWGTNGINIDGISIPDSAALQVPVVAATTPGERLPDPTNPGLLVKDGKPFLAFASIGAGLHERTIAALTSVIDFGMTPQQAINAPAYGFYNQTTKAQTFGTGDLNPELVKQVQAMGLNIEESDSMRGYWIGILIDPQTGELKGGTPRGFDLTMGGRAVGY